MFIRGSILLVLCCLLPTGKSIGETTGGKVARVAGDLVYLTGLTGSAPLWSVVDVVGQGEGTRLEVVKELNEMLVARVLKRGSRISVGDGVTLIEKGSSQSVTKSRRVVHATRVSSGPSIDGNLNEAAWSEATPVKGLVQRKRLS